ncbi:MAG TPA: L-2-hydroxyglutarate oxidase [Ignavibacteria bacterium]|nr:L-2-hydroxyglutarate oxidase [Ignavibacteria bacterium]
MREKYDVILIGAGIIGLATAYNLIKKNPGVKLCIIEKEDVIAKHQTGNNSGVIHSGIYYKPGSLKEQNCIRGYKMLLEFCNEHNIKYDICGKLIVATNEHELKALQILYDKGIQNGLQGLRIISREEAKEIEPYVNCVKAIHVPQTGIIDYSNVTEKIFDILYKHGVNIKLKEKLKDVDEDSNCVTVITDKDDYECKIFVSCAGLQSDRIAKLTNNKLDVRIIPFRGEYFNIKEHKRYLVNHLIYPVPDPQFPFLGVHFTRMIDGNVEAGPNAVLAMKREGYGKLDMNIKDMKDTFTWSGFYHITWKHWQTGIYEFYRSLMKYEFVNSLQKLIPDITGKDLVPGGSGVRAQAVDKHGNLIDDFLFAEDKRIINVLNAPSPAATSSLSVGDTISDKIISRL